MGTIRIEGLRIEAVIGALPEERAAPQTVLASIEVEADTAGAAEEDDLARALDYRELADCVRRLAVEGRFALLETLAERAAHELQRRFAVGRVRVEVRKPGAIPDAEWAGVIVDVVQSCRVETQHPAGDGR